MPPGTAPGSWQLLERLGSGGSAEVWRSVDTTGREAALKILKAEFREHRNAGEFLRREHEFLTALAHPNVVTTLGITEHQGGGALVLEYLPGGDLVSLVGSHPRHWILALRDVLGALMFVHGCGVAHGDLKARNVLFAADGAPRLIDFASARPWPPDRPIIREPGLPGWRGLEAADCFAFGALLFELLTGQLPYGSEGTPQASGRPLPVPAAWDAGAAPLMAAAVAALTAGGGPVGGLSMFMDAIESAVVTYG